MDRQYDAVKMVAIVAIIAIAAFFIITAMHNNALDQSGRVINMNSDTASRPHCPAHVDGLAGAGCQVYWAGDCTTHNGTSSVGPNGPCCLIGANCFSINANGDLIGSAINLNDKGASQNQ